jgi:hypothetical protein
MLKTACEAPFFSKWRSGALLVTFAFMVQSLL